MTTDAKEASDNASQALAEATAAVGRVCAIATVHRRQIDQCIRLLEHAASPAGQAQYAGCVSAVYAILKSGPMSEAELEEMLSGLSAR